ncbi:MAG: hypothetical protein ACOCS7_02910, partial [Halolamina sp.]
VHPKKGRLYHVYQGKWTPLGSPDDMDEVLRRYDDIELSLVKPELLTVAGLMATFRRLLERPGNPLGLAERTRSEYLRNLKPSGRLARVFGHMPLDKVRPRHIGEYLDAHPAPVMANREIALLSRMFSYAIGRGYDGFNPCRHIHRNKERARDRYVEHWEYAAVFEQATVLGQFRELYLLCEVDDELLIVDQHAAHERVNFERLREALAEEAVPSASLSEPVTLSLSPGGRAAVGTHAETLARLGFDVTPFGGGTVRVRAVPAPLGRAADPESLRETLDSLRDGETPADPQAELLKDLACHPSLKAGDELDRADARELLAQLGACEQPFACPHGRPTVLSIEEATLARGFERDARRFG